MEKSAVELNLFYFPFHVLHERSACTVEGEDAAFESSAPA
jgi:hypothetical protein